MSKMPTYEVLKGTERMGFVTAVSFAKAVAKAHGLYGKFVDVELAANKRPRPSERQQASQGQQAKTARRYPTDGFEARRAALIAEVMGN